VDQVEFWHLGQAKLFERGTSEAVYFRMYCSATAGEASSGHEHRGQIEDPAGAFALQAGQSQGYSVMRSNT
jgi:hypothetical protein